MPLKFEITLPCLAGTYDSKSMKLCCPVIVAERLNNPNLKCQWSWRADKISAYLSSRCQLPPHRLRDIHLCLGHPVRPVNNEERFHLCAMGFAHCRSADSGQMDLEKLSHWQCCKSYVPVSRHLGDPPTALWSSASTDIA